MFTVYVLKNNSDKIYIGWTSNLEKRINRHNGKLKSKATSYTNKNRDGEWVLIYSEEFETRAEAIKREKELKSYQGRKFIKDNYLHR